MLKRGLRDRFTEEKGSITVEAAIILPLVLGCCALLAWLLLLARTEAALQEAVNEAVKTTAAHAYPLDVLAVTYRHHPLVQEWEKRINAFLPKSIQIMLQEQWPASLSPRSGEGLGVWSESSIHDRWATPYLMEFVDRNWRGEPLLKQDRLKVSRVLLPTFTSESTSYFGMVAEYRMTLPVPFFQREIVLKAAAVERCWVGEKQGGRD